jgi:carboxypeptidase PM20D1
MHSPAADQVARHLAALIRIPTVTVNPEDGPTEEEARPHFAAFRAALEEFYPRTFAAAQVDVVGFAGLLLRLPGAAADKPVVLMAHQDVVPVPEDWKAEGWEHPPFDGVIAEGHVHGRGALDDKGALVVVCEAVESLLAEGWTPPQDLYLLFGSDEELNGPSAVAAVALLEERGVVPHMVVDEGGAVALEAFPGVEGETAVIGVSEKGIVTLELTAVSEGGHASTPPRQSAAGILAAAITRLEKNPFPPSVHEVSREMLATVAPHASGKAGRALRAAARFPGPLAPVLGRVSPEMSAMVRTTTAVTQLAGSPAHNVLATRARAVVNLRIATGSSVAQTAARVERVIRDSRVSVRVVEGSEPSPVSPRGEDPRWLALHDAIGRSYPDALVVPYIMIAASDGRHMARIAPAVYRFSPLRMTREQRVAIHGPNEKVEVDALGRGVQFYRALLNSERLG